jgi:geranylgeranyl diphosphate synthase type I
VLSDFKRYGRYLGKAFQIRDDILGVFGDPKRTGKSVLSDMREGKKTFLALKALKELRIMNDKLRINKFNRIWGNREAGMKELEWIRRVMEETGALDYAKERAGDLARKAKELIKKDPLDKKAKQFLMGVTHFVVERSE